MVQTIGQQGLDFLAIQEKFLRKTTVERQVPQQQPVGQGEDEGQSEPPFVPDGEGPSMQGT